MKTIPLYRVQLAIGLVADSLRKKTNPVLPLRLIKIGASMHFDKFGFNLSKPLLGGTYAHRPAPAQALASTASSRKVMGRGCEASSQIRAMLRNTVCR